MSTKDKLLQEAYDEIFAKVIEMIAVKKYEPQLIAATLIAQSLRIYKTILKVKLTMSQKTKCLSMVNG